MQKNLHKGGPIRKTKVSATLLFILAFSLLFISCPVKKFLLTSFIHHSSSVTAGYETTNDKNSKIDYAFAKGHCSFATDRFCTSDSCRIKILSPVFFVNSSNASGFKINYFVAGLNAHNSWSTNHKNLSVPLFLQHLRLLI